MQFTHSPEISWSTWFSQACIQEDHLTELGEYLQKKLSGGIFIDVPCGHASTSIVGSAQRLGVSTCIEVDADAEVLGNRSQHSPRSVENMTVYTHQADILEFVQKLDVHSNAQKRAIYISGLQPDEEFCKDPMNVSSIVVPYLESLYTELGRCSGVGDLVILNDANTLVLGIDEQEYPNIHPAIALLKQNFTLQRTCPFNKVHVFEKVFPSINS